MSEAVKRYTWTASGMFENPIISDRPRWVSAADFDKAEADHQAALAEARREALGEAINVAAQFNDPEHVHNIVNALKELLQPPEPVKSTSEAEKER